MSSGWRHRLTFQTLAADGAGSSFSCGRSEGLHGVRWENEYLELKKFCARRQFPQIQDIAFDASGDLYGAGRAALFKIDTATGEPESIHRRSDGECWTPDALVAVHAPVVTPHDKSSGVTDDQAAASSVHTFLSSLGLDHLYYAAFREQALEDVSLLRDMLRNSTRAEFDRVLKSELGVDKMGHRQRIAAALR